MSEQEKKSRVRKLLSFDQLDAHMARRALRYLKEKAAVDPQPLLQNNTEHLQPFDADDGRWWNAQKRIKLNDWCDKKPENMKMWSSKMSAMEKRILITHIVGESQMEREKLGIDFRAALFEKTGCGVRIDGTGQELIRPQAMENFELAESDDAASLDSGGWSRSDNDSDFWGEEDSQDGDSLTEGQSSCSGEDQCSDYERNDTEDDDVAEDVVFGDGNEGDESGSRKRDAKRHSFCGLSYVPKGMMKSEGLISTDVDNNPSILEGQDILVRTGDVSSFRWSHCVVDAAQPEGEALVKPGAVIEAYYGVPGWIEGTVIRIALSNKNEDAVVGAEQRPSGDAAELGVGARQRHAKEK